MINQVYQLIKPKLINVEYEEIDINNKNNILIRPNYMALCHADQRYYQGKRDPKILAKKLPMALIHECCGIVLADPTNTYDVGQKVVLIPNQPPRESDDEFYENYMEGTKFLSSGYNGFMQESLSLPIDRVVAYDKNVDDRVAAISEFISVAMHGVDRLIKIAHSKKQRIAIIGDGSLSFVVANVLNYILPESELVIVGRHEEKLNLFSFVKERYIANYLPENLSFDHAFECTGGDGSGYAINDIINYIKPQGSVILMGVSENKVNINTRDVLEKGLTLIGSSRSGREDFEKTVDMLKNKKIEKRLKNIIFEDDAVRSINDIHRVFATDINTPFKTVFKWRL